MRTIGVGVEGPSDQIFWRRYLHRIFPQTHFDVRSLKSRPKLIAATPKLLDSFRAAGYAGAIILVDRDDDPCFESVVELFERSVQGTLREPLTRRTYQLCTAVRELESWFLADSTAIRELLGGVSYEARADTARAGAGLLRRLWKEKYGANAPFNKIYIADEIGKRFDHQRARAHSASLRTAWTRIENLTKRLT